MARGPGGVYTPTAGNPVVPGTVIESDWANPLVTDLGNEITDSLSRSGKGGMLAPLRGLSGSAALPTFSFTEEPSTGRYRAGPGQVVESVDGTPVVRYLASGLEQWDSNIMDWVPLTPRDALGTPFDPNPSNLTSTNVQDAIEEVNAKSGGVITADSVSYDDTNVYFPAATVQQAIDRLGADLSSNATDLGGVYDAVLINIADIDLLEQRMTLTEINTGNNATEIGLLQTRVTNNETSISNNASAISSLQFVDQDHDSRITQNATNIGVVYDITQVNADNISTNVNAINQNAADIDTNLTLLGILFGWFPGDVLAVLHGGTGVTTSTGSTSVVLSNAPTLTNPTLNGGTINDAGLYNCGTVNLEMYGASSVDAAGSLTVPTVSANDSSTNAASTAFVKSLGYGSGQCRFDGPLANANGYYCAFVDLRSVAQWSFIQWWERTLANHPGTNITFPLSMNFNDYALSMQSIITGQVGLDTCPGVTSRSNGSMQVVNNNWNTSWLVQGRADYSVAFAEIPLSGDRYFNKLTRTEHIEQIHGPWGDDPDVVILPPGSPFWGDPLPRDEELTFDIDGLPLARVARVVPLAETIVNLLLTAGLTKSRLSVALYADQRGDPSALASFNADMDALVLAEPYTLAQFIEHL